MELEQFREYRWGEHIRVVVQRMGWKRILDCSAEFSEFAVRESSRMKDREILINIIVLLLKHSQLTVYRDGVALPNGTHEIGNGFSITLPMTREAMESDKQPTEIGTFLSDSVQELNSHTVQSFLERVLARIETLTKFSPASSG